MAKPTARFVCQSCGAIAPRWAGRCEACGEWNTIVEEPNGPGVSKTKATGKIRFFDLAGTADPPPRTATGIAEFDRVLGGGLVAGSAVLLAGDPGIGKSTLLLQAAAALANAGRRVLYISGEEAVEQVRLRARRLGLSGAKLELAAAINLRDITATLALAKDAALVGVQAIARAASVERLLAVTNASHVLAAEWFMSDSVISHDYEAFWTERGGQPSGEDGYILPMPNYQARVAATATPRLVDRYRAALSDQIALSMKFNL